MALGRVADTSWLYAVFNEADPHHLVADADVSVPVVTLVPTAIMDELLDLVRYRQGKVPALQVLKALQALPHFDLWYPTDEEGALAVWESSPHLSLHDAHAVACARATGFPLATFDERQRDASLNA